MQFLKKMLSKHHKSSSELMLDEKQNQKKINLSKTTKKSLDKESLEEVMAFAREQIELAKTNR